MGPVIEYSIETQAGVLFTRAPAYGKQFKVNEAVCVRVKPNDIVIIPENDTKNTKEAQKS
jgi:urease beta subunit